jgi:hypothetical protein
MPDVGQASFSGKLVGIAYSVAHNRGGARFGLTEFSGVWAEPQTRCAAIETNARSYSSTSDQGDEAIQSVNLNLTPEADCGPEDRHWRRPSISRAIRYDTFSHGWAFRP